MVKDLAKNSTAHLAQNIKRFMKVKSWTASGLAKKSGVSVASISRILAGQVNPGLAHVASIADALDVPIDALTQAPQRVRPVVKPLVDKHDEETQKSQSDVALSYETDVLVSFLLKETNYTPNEAARLLADAATGSWVHSWTQDYVPSGGFNQPRPTLAMQISPGVVSVDVAFPEGLFEAGSIVSLISVITAACTSTGAQVQDICIPPILLRTYRGAFFGVQGLRDRAQKWGRPLLAATMRPSLGLSPRLMGQAAAECLRGGIDITCDPTLLHHIPSSSWRDRFNYMADAVANAQNGTDEIKYHAVNVTAATSDEMLKRVEFAAEQGTHAVLVDSGAVGWAGVQTLAACCRENDLLLCALGGRALHNGPLSQQLVAKLLRFAGADVVSVGSPLRGSSAARRNVKGITRALEGHNMAAYPEGLLMFDQPTCGLAAAWPACGGGHNAWHFPQLMDALGNDIILQCGGSTMGHPWGGFAGAMANRVALEALVKAKIEGKNLASEGRGVLKQAAKHSSELREALRYWKEGAFLFGVINNTDKQKIEGIVVPPGKGKKPKLTPIDAPKDDA